MQGIEMTEGHEHEWVERAAMRSFDIIAEMAPERSVGAEDLFYFFSLIALGVTKDVDTSLDIFIEMAETINENREKFYAAMAELEGWVH